MAGTQLIHLERYAPDAKALVVAAQKLADARTHANVDIDHLLSVLRTERVEGAEDVVRGWRPDLDRLPRAAAGELAYLSQDLLDLLVAAERAAGEGRVEVRHLLEALRARLTPPPSVLAVLEPPTPRPKRPRVAPSTDALCDLLLRDERASTLGMTTEHATVAFDCGEGRNVRVVLFARAIQLEAVLEADDEDDADDPVHEMAEEILVVLQQATGWHLRSDHDYDGFDVAGECPSCGVEIFEWQEGCVACGAAIADEEDDEEADEDDDGPSPRRLASLAVPAADEVSPWHRARPLASVGAVVACLRELRGARVLHQNDATAVVIVPAPGGASLRASVHRGAAAIDALTEDEEPSEAVQALARRVIGAVQDVTGWYVHAPAYAEFEPCGACLKCACEVFRRNERCPACGADVPSDWRPRSELVAEALVAELVAEGLLLVVDGREEVERRVATLLRSRAGTAAQVLDVLGDLDEVEEVFADALALERVLGRAMREADRRLADRSLTSPRRT